MPTRHCRPSSGWWLSCGILIALAALTIASPRLFPFNMDEFGHLAPVGWYAYPLNETLNDFREGSHLYDMRLPFTNVYLPLRTYPYIGNLSFLPYLPFWLLIRDPVSARIQGVVFFSIAILLLARLARARYETALLAALVFPMFFFSFMLDTGPTGLMLILLSGTFLSLRRVLEHGTPAKPEDATPPRHDAHPYLFGALAGILAFLGCFLKLVFFWFAFPIAVFALILGWRSLARSARTRKAIVLAMAVFAVLTGVLLLSRTRTGAFYYHEFGKQVDQSAATTIETAARMSAFFSDGTTFATRHLHIPRSFYDVFPLLLAAALIARALLWRKDRGAVLLAAGLGIPVFAIMCASPKACHPHHAVLAMFFLVWGCAIAMRDLAGRPKAALFVAILLYWGALGLRLPRAEIDPLADFDKDRLLETIRSERLDAGAVQIHVGWGTYYISNLFGSRDQAVVYLDYDRGIPERSELEIVKAKAEGLGRGILAVTDDPATFLESDCVHEVLGPPLRQTIMGHWGAIRYVR
ncbi:MAG: hypothetical protein ACE15D_01465 [Candidatus Eisenbacteria bacterium]|nr:hypothetical protein [Candidatus Eisenbacteria bacterium]